MRNKVSIGSIYIEITNDCNYTCAYCYNESHPGPDSSMDVSAIKSALTGLRALGLNTVTFSGGEPLLHPALNEAVQYALSLGLHVHLITNGSLMREYWADLIARNDVSIQITMDATDKLTNSITRGATAFDDTEDCIDCLRKAGALRKLVLRCNLGNHNLDRIAPIMEYCRKKGIVHVQYALVTPDGRGKQFDCISRVKDYRKIDDLKDDINRSAERIGISANTVNFETNLLCPMCSESSNESYHLYMNYKGEVYPCQELVSSRYLLADCVSGINDSIAERCHSIVLSELEKQRDKLQCVSCKYGVLCKGGCLADTERWGLGICNARKKKCRDYLLNNWMRNGRV